MFMRECIRYPWRCVPGCDLETQGWLIPGVDGVVIGVPLDILM